MIEPFTVTTPALPWRLEVKPTTGLFVVSTNGALLFRFDPEAKTIYPWDKRAGREVEIRLDDLLASENQ